MHATVIYESLTGNTRRAAECIAAEFGRGGASATVCPVTDVDHGALARSDVVIVGSWTDGVFVVGQRPGRAGRLRSLPVLSGKDCFVYCTYAINPGRTLAKLTAILEERGATVLGGLAIRRNRIAAGAEELVEGILAARPVR